MKQTQILSGNFATGEGNKGNFSGYNASGERIFIHRKAMENAGWKKDADVKYPFFVISGVRDITPFDENGEPTNTKVPRLQALSVFPTKEALIAAYNSDKQLEIEAKAALAVSAKSSGLTEKAVDALLAASV